VFWKTILPLWQTTTLYPLPARTGALSRIKTKDKGLENPGLVQPLIASALRFAPAKAIFVR
jgi:hypothetical protein